MTLVRVGLISPNRDFSKAAEELAEELRVSLLISRYKAQEIDSLLEGWEKGKAVEAIITDEAIAGLLRGKTSLPLVTVQVSGYQILSALNKAKMLGPRVVVVDFDQFSSRKETSCTDNFFDGDINFLFYREQSELLDALNVLKGEVDAVVGCAGTVEESAETVGIPAFIVQSDRSFIKDALEKALSIGKMYRRNVKLCHSLQAILDNAGDGIMAVDGKDNVAIFNPVVEKITGLRTEEVLGQSIKQVVKRNPICKELFGDGNAVTRQTILLKDWRLMVNRTRISTGIYTGLVITFQVSEDIKLKNKVPKELSSKGLVAQYRFSDIVGQSAMMHETVREARKYSRSDAALLITGESGTGKELFAQSIHNESSRKNGPFVAINCAALPENLLESELFGYEEGAFTGARRGGKQGLFALAHGGTIFLDEIGDLSPSLQARLLRVLQQKEVMPVGGRRVIPVDVRITSATNINLREAVEKGSFREDLFYRLYVLRLHIPPLRMRMEDLVLLFRHFYQQRVRIGNAELNEQNLNKLKTYMWPGNVRELEGFVERYVALGEEDTTNLTTFKNLLTKLKSSFQAECAGFKDKQILMVKLASMEEMERQIIEQASEMIEGSKGEVADALGLSRTTLWKKLKKI